MNEPVERSVEERLRKLEATVENLQHVLKGLIDSLARREHAAPEPRRPEAPRARPAPPSIRDRMQEAAAAPLWAPQPPPKITRAPGALATLMARGQQFWISRVGIVLLLVSLALLFQYAVEEGWLTPTIRVVFGVALGAVLVAIGLRVRQRQQWFSQIMFGGASATWYITGFAAFQVLHVVSFAVAFGFMVLVTVYTFWAAVKQHAPVLAALGAFGGLGTPFFLYTESGTVPGLMAYTCLVLIGTSAIYLFCGWRSLLWTTAFGAWSVVALGFDRTTLTNKLALEFGMATIWLLFWIVPVAREYLAESSPARWPRPPLDLSRRVLGLSEEWLRQRDVSVLVLAVSLTTLFGSLSLWELPSDTLWGVIAAGGALLFAVVAWRLTTLGNLAIVAAGHAVTAAVLAATAILLLCGPHLQIVLWTVEAAALSFLAHRLHHRPLEITAQVQFAIVGLWLLQRFVGDPLPEVSVWSTGALANAGVVAVTIGAIRWVPPEMRRWYWLAAHGAVLAWVWRELTGLTGGSGIVTTVWGVYGLALLLTVKRARTIGLATMFLAVAKLVLFDLSQVEQIWRILLFMGFGAVFLAIGYYFRRLWERD